GEVGGRRIAVADGVGRGRGTQGGGAERIREVAAGIGRGHVGHAVDRDRHAALRHGKPPRGGEVAPNRRRGGAVGDRRRGQAGEDRRRRVDRERAVDERGDVVIGGGEGARVRRDDVGAGIDRRDGRPTEGCGPTDYHTGLVVDEPAQPGRERREGRA